MILGQFEFASIDEDFVNFWMANGTKFEIDLQGHYVAKNLQKCVLILMQVSEYESNQNWWLKTPKKVS